MRPGHLEASRTPEILANEFLAFVFARDAEDVAKLISFFHLVDSRAEAEIEFEIEATGCLQLRIVADGGRQEGSDGSQRLGPRPEPY